MMRTGDIAGAVGKGLAAGLIGTAAMTISSTIEARVRQREPSTAPADAAAKVLGIEHPRLHDGHLPARHPRHAGSCGADLRRHPQRMRRSTGFYPVEVPVEGGWRGEAHENLLVDVRTAHGPDAPTTLQVLEAADATARALEAEHGPLT